VLHRALDDTFDPDVRHRVTVLTLARTMANGCFRFAAPFLAVIAHGNGTSLAGLGVALAVGELSGLLSPLNGELVERMHRRTAMTVGLAGVAAGSVLAAGSRQPVLFAVALVLIAQSKVMFDLGLGAWISDRVPYSQRSRVIGLTETSWAMGLLVGVTTMGLVTAATNYRVGYAVGSIAVGTMSLVIWRSIKPDIGAHHHSQRAERGRIELGRTALTALGMFSLMGASQSLFVTFGSWLIDRFDFTAAMLSAVTFGLGFAELFASVSSARKADGWGKEFSTAFGAAIMIPSGIGVAMWNGHLAIALPLVIVAIAAFEFAVVSAIPLGTMLVPGSPARGMALMFGAGTFGRAVVSLAATRIYAHDGITWPAVMCVCFASVTVLTMLRLRTLGRAEPRTAH
jgi:predicted MFS family arabinose efflux permease